MWMIRKARTRTKSSRVVNVRAIADEQKGPTCGFEAVENILQMFYDVGNNLSDTDLLVRAKRYGAVIHTPAGYMLHIGAYRRILADYGIACRWYPFDRDRVLLPALYNNQGVLAVGEGYHLDRKHYTSKGAHAFVLTNYFTDVARRYIFGYTGIDSNVSNVEVRWPWQNVERALLDSSRSLGKSLLITERTLNWSGKPRYYIMNRQRQLIPAYS
jgi:hypothetical protein